MKLNAIISISKWILKGAPMDGLEHMSRWDVIRTSYRSWKIREMSKEDIRKTGIHFDEMTHRMGKKN